MTQFKVNDHGWTDLSVYNNEGYANSSEKVVPGNYLTLLKFQIWKKKKFDAAHFLDARGDEKQVSNLEGP